MSYPIGFIPWFAAASPSPYDYDYVEVCRWGQQPQVIFDMRKIKPGLDIDGLYWKPILFDKAADRKARK